VNEGLRGVYTEAAGTKRYRQREQLPACHDLLVPEMLVQVQLATAPA